MQETERCPESKTWDTPSGVVGGSEERWKHKVSFFHRHAQAKLEKGAVSSLFTWDPNVDNRFPWCPLPATLNRSIPWRTNNFSVMTSYPPYSNNNNKLYQWN